MKKIYFLMTLIFVSITMSFAQETEEDPFADYSYLWEKTKKPKKEKKNKQKETTPVEKVVAPATIDTLSNNLVISDSLSVLDSAQVSSTPAVIDSSYQRVFYVPIDTVESEDLLSPEELAAIERDKNVQDSLRQIKKADKRAKRKEKLAAKGPKEDFRGGLPSSSSSAINGGFTYTIIDGKAYAGLILSPEFSIGKVGVGINVPILYGLDDKSIRTEIFEDGVGIARLINYVRYGQQKVDPIYVKVGALSNTMIGYGGLINNYGNSISYEKSKIGLHYDINVKGTAGIEGLYSDFDPTSLNLLAVRPYVRPLRWTAIPIVESLEIGSTYVSDKDQTALFGTGNVKKTYQFTKDGVSALGFDAGITLLRIPFIQIDLFSNYSTLKVSTPALKDSISAAVTSAAIDANATNFKDGSGVSAGLNFRFHFIANVLSTDVRIERLSYSDYYLPQFFDSYYEINKDQKLFSLASARKMSGIYGSLTGQILNKVKLGGSVMIPDHISETAPATVAVNADVEKLADKISINARYFKGGLLDLKDAFKLDERSLASVRFTYHLNKFLVMGVNYTWAFANTESGFKTTQYVAPFFGLSIQF